jgi:hypothetical protein
MFQYLIIRINVGPFAMELKYMFTIGKIDTNFHLCDDNEGGRENRTLFVYAI